jgi:hypothetical protein
MVTDEIATRIDECRAAIDAANAVPVDQLTIPELIDSLRMNDLAARLVHDCQLRLIGRLRRSAPPVALGGTPLARALSVRLRIPEAYASQLIDEAIELGYG